MREAWERVALGALTTKRKDFTPVIADEHYKVVGVQRSGWGLVDREPVRGDSMKFTKLMELEEDDLVYRVITAFEAPSTVVGSAFAGTFVTPQTFPVFKIRSDRIMPAYMRLLTTSPVFHDAMAERCTGTVLRRKTISVGAFQSIPITLPPLAEQGRVVDLLDALDDAIEAAEAAVLRTLGVLEIARDQAIWTPGPTVPLSELCEIKSKLVDPTTVENRILPHVGTERIVSVTGDLRGVQSAAADGVISGKYGYTDEDVIYSKIRPNLRKVALPTGAGLCSADAYPLRPKAGIDRTFLKHLLISRPFTKIAAGRSGRTKMPKINQSELFSIDVPNTAEVDQIRLGAVFGAMDDAREAADDYVLSLRTTRTNLLAALLSGDHEIPSSYDEHLGVVE